MNAGDTFFTLLLARPEASRSIGGRLDARHGARQFVCLKSILISVPLLILYLHRTFPWLASASGPQRAPTRCCSRITSRSCERGVEAGPHRRLHSAAMRWSVRTRRTLGGPPRQVPARAPGLVGRGQAVRIFPGGPQAGEGDLFERARELGLDVVRVPGLTRGLAPAGDLRTRRFLRRALAEFAPDVVHTHASKAGALGRSASAELERVARVHTFHGHVLEGYFGASLSRGLVALRRRLARSTDRVVAVSHGRRTISCVWAWSKRASWS